MPKFIEESARRGDVESLTTQQQEFVKHLIASDDFNAAKAAEKAGYKHPQQLGPRLLSNEIIAKAVGFEVRKRRERLDFKADEVLTQLVNAFYLDPLEIYEKVDDFEYRVKDLASIPLHIRRCITGIETGKRYFKDGTLKEAYVSVKTMSKDALVPLICKHIGLVDAKGNPTPGELAGDFVATLLKKVEENRNVIDAIATTVPREPKGPSQDDTTAIEHAGDVPTEDRSDDDQGLQLGDQ
jgi:phage terminase small subunit